MLTMSPKAWLPTEYYIGHDAGLKLGPGMTVEVILPCTTSLTRWILGPHTSQNSSTGKSHGEGEEGNLCVVGVGAQDPQR